MAQKSSDSSFNIVLFDKLWLCKEKILLRPD